MLRRLLLMLMVLLVGCTAQPVDSASLALTLTAAAQNSNPGESAKTAQDATINSVTLTSPPADVLVEPTLTPPSPESQETMLADPGSTSTPVGKNCPSPENWQEMPVTPVVSPHARQIYLFGLEKGNKPKSFSVIGDCQNVPTVFMGVFDNPNEYRLGEKYQYLMPVIENFAGSYARHSFAVKGGFNVAAVLNSFVADAKACEKKESPLACELRINKPSIAIISMETWWANRRTEGYERYLRMILDEVIANGTVPILATKADNLEGEHHINQAIARLACEYDVPLWNFWRAVQPLPDHGLWSDGFHLSIGQSYFDDPAEMKGARPVRNLTGLQALDVVWRNVTEQELAKP